MSYEWLVYATPFGLALDIVGFWLIIQYGHSFFIKVSASAPDPEKGKDGDIWVQHGGDEATDTSYMRILRRAQSGVALIFSGFLLQIFGTIIANLQL